MVVGNIVEGIAGMVVLVGNVDVVEDLLDKVVPTGMLFPAVVEAEAVRVHEALLAPVVAGSKEKYS